MLRSNVLIVQWHFEAGELRYLRCFQMDFEQLCSAKMPVHAGSLAGKLSQRFHVNINWYQREPLSALWTLSFNFMQNFIWSPEVRAFIQHMTTTLTGNALRHFERTPYGDKIRMDLIYLSVPRKQKSIHAYLSVSLLSLRGKLMISVLTHK